MTAIGKSGELAHKKQQVTGIGVGVAHRVVRALMLSLVLISPYVGADELPGADAGNPTEPREEIELREKGTDVFYLSARFGQEDAVELMLDTGSGYLAVNEQVLETLEDQGMAQYQRHIHARLASGAVRKVPIYKVAQLSLGQGCTVYNVEAAILSGKSRNILGLNVLKQMTSFSVSFNPPRLVLNGCRRAEQLAKTDIPTIN